MLIRTVDFPDYISPSWKQSSICSRASADDRPPPRCYLTSCTTGKKLAVASVGLCVLQPTQKKTNCEFFQANHMPSAAGCQAYGEKHLAHHLHRFCSSCFRSQIPCPVFPSLVQQVVPPLPQVPAGSLPVAAPMPGDSCLAQHTAKDPGCKHVRTQWPSSSRGRQERFGHNTVLLLVCKESNQG